MLLELYKKCVNFKNFSRKIYYYIEYYIFKGGEIMQDCIFCKIIKGEIPCQKVYEDDMVLSFKDIEPAAPSHVLIIPKKHISSLNDVTEEDSKIIAHVFMAAKKIVKELGIDKDGYRIVSNCGENGGQSVPHVHFHLLGGRSLQWPPG